MGSLGRPRPPRPYVGRQRTPVYRHELSAGAWQVLWWLLCNIDEQARVRRGWKSEAARQMGRHHTWVHRNVNALARSGLVEELSRPPCVKVLIDRFSG